MSTAIFPLTFASEELYLLTAIGLGFLFGFSLERAGFGNARKLAAQFYLYDMTVFKVMFTAILVAMVGLYALNGLGLVDMSMMWINPTFMWAQVIGGFLLGVGFIVSGLCPGTSVVSAASGRIDGVVAFVGIFIGTAVFAIAVDVVPGMEALYNGGSMGVSILPELLAVPTQLFVLGVVIMAGAAFVGAEKVEKIFQRKYGMIELEPKVTRRTPRLKFAVAGSLALVAVFAAFAPPRTIERPARPMDSIEPLELAELIIAGDPDLKILDFRTIAGEDGAESIPGACGCGTDIDMATETANSVPPGTKIVIYDDVGIWSEVPGAWPETVEYRYLRGGYAAWETDVRTAAEPTGHTLAERERIERQNQISAYFTGAAVQTTSTSAPPPVMPMGGGAKKKKAGGC
jgi:uncharacterized membrane protein YedE/YeeE